MTGNQYSALVQQWSKDRADGYIDRLDGYIASKGKQRHSLVQQWSKGKTSCCKPSGNGEVLP